MTDHLHPDPLPAMLAVMCTGPGFEEGEAKNLLDAVLSSLALGAGRVMN